MTSLRMAGSQVLGTVSDTASAISSTVNALAGGMNIINDYVTTARNKQREANVVSMTTFRQQLMEDATLEAVKRQENIANYIGNDPTKTAAYDKFWEKLQKEFDKYDNKITEENS